MGLMSGTSGSVTVVANLTNRGKELLHNSIRPSSSLLSLAAGLQALKNPLITKFAFGDSDANYKAIAAGYTLTANYVPESSAFRPAIRGFCLASGAYRPGTPVIYVNNDNSSTIISVPWNIAALSPSQADCKKEFTLKTEWPAGELFSDSYSAELVPPSSFVTEAFYKLFTVEKTGNKLTLTFNSDNSLAGSTLRNYNFSLVVTSQITNASKTIVIELT
jgi:hypothetical protein